MTWVKTSDKLPDKNLDVDIKFKDGSCVSGYLCPCCGNEFRCSILGFAFTEWPEYWRMKVKR